MVIRVGDWKLVASGNDPPELYDLKTDRAEQFNLAASMPDKVKELELAWQRQTDSFTELVKKTLPDQKPKAGSAIGNRTNQFTLPGPRPTLPEGG